MEENKHENTPILHHPLASVARLGDMDGNIQLLLMRKMQLI